MEVQVTGKGNAGDPRNVRAYIGTRMSPADIKRVQMREERFGRVIEGVCPNCGRPVRKPRSGPTARFCSASCRKNFSRRKRQIRQIKKQGESLETALELKRQSEDYLARTTGLDEQARNLRHERNKLQEEIRLTLMTQLYIIMRGKPELIEQAPRDGYVRRLVNEIDDLGRTGDAERMLRHRGYTGKMPK